MADPRLSARLMTQQRRDVGTLLRAWLPHLPQAQRPTWDEWDQACERLYGPVNVGAEVIRHE